MPAKTAQELQAQVTKFIADARAKAVGGLTVVEVGSLVVALLRLAVDGLDSIQMDKRAKRAWALDAVGHLFDAVAGFAVPVYLTPVWVVARPIVRQLVLAAASGALEQVLALVRDAAPATVEVTPA